MPPPQLPPNSNAKPPPYPAPENAPYQDVFGIAYGDFDTDWQVWDWLEPATYFSKTIEKPPPQGFFIPQSLWLIPKKDNLPADHPLLEVERTVVIPFQQASSINIKKDDLIQRNSDSSLWVVKLVELPMEKDWRCHLIHAPQRYLANI